MEKLIIFRGVEREDLEVCIQKLNQDKNLDSRSFFIKSRRLFSLKSCWLISGKPATKFRFGNLSERSVGSNHLPTKIK